MLKSLLISVVLLCATQIAVAQSAIGMELRVIITAEIDTSAHV